MVDRETIEDDDLLQLRTTLRRLLERQATRASDPPPCPAEEFDPHLWKLLTQQVGVAGLAVPERFGGSGFGYPECHLVLSELGRAGAASPFLASSVLATQALLLAADEGATGDLLPELAAGTRTAALILPTTGVALTATGTGGSWLIDGRARHVLDGARSDLLLAFAEPEESGPALFLLDVTDPGLRRTRSPTLDQTLHLADVHCQAVPARRLSGPGTVTAATGGRPMAERLADLAATAITAEQIGGARRCLELTVEYARQRVQFGRPIGSFQAVKHRLADLLVLVESAESASQAAARAWSDEVGEAPVDVADVDETDDAGDTDPAWVLASLAKSYCSEAFRAVAAETIQLHGGIGFTWEHSAHRYFKRAHSTAALFGDAAYHRRRLADHLGLLAPSAHSGGSSLR